MSDESQALLKVQKAARALGVSKTFLYKLPRATPGIYRFGRAVRYDIEKLREWAAAQARGEGE
jgi:hypothetical protein